ncbi:MAG TPA: ATP synthase F1 subunit gamma [Thermoanaerobaculia bacterium]|jgi:F-type H+-transporting ATPase subunit gamma|nr:ATP synthase F1 subunit gamma [Thermoanaerobaculia bacterium]
MANRRVLVKRRKSIRNIRKITRTMQLIATARFQAAYNRAVATKPYNEKLAELVADLSSAASASGGVEHPLLKENDSNKTALVAITSTRGLCGGYNSNVLRVAIEHLDAQDKAGHQVDVHMAGKKGISYFRFLKRPMVEQITNVGDVPRFDQVEPIANALMDSFIKGEISAAYVSYMKFVSTGTQRPVVVQLLPLARKAPENTEGEVAAPTGQVEFSPSPQKLLDSLLPASVRVQLFQAFTDAVVSEQVARMVAMKAATDAAGDMIKSLTREYNRARQTAITMELLDIVGGANALA